MAAMAVLAGCSAGSSDAADPPRSDRSTTTTTAEPHDDPSTTTTTDQPDDGDQVWSDTLPMADGALLFDDLLLARAQMDTSTSSSDGASPEAITWKVSLAKTGELVGVVSVASSDADLPTPVLGRDADGKAVMAVRRDVRIAGSGIEPGRTDQLLSLYDVATGMPRWEVDALLGDPRSSDPNSTSGTLPIEPTGFAGGNLIGYSHSGIPAQSEESKIKAVHLKDGSLAWETPAQAVQYIDTVGDEVMTTKASAGLGHVDDTVFDTMEVRNAKTGATTSTLTFPPAKSTSFVGDTQSTYAEINRVVQQEGGGYVVDVTIPSLDSDDSVVRTNRVEALDAALKSKWKVDDTTLEDSPGFGVVVLSVGTYNDSGVGLQGVAFKDGKKLWSKSADDLDATEFSLDASIDASGDAPDNRGFVMGTARDERSSGSALVVLDARTGEQVYVGSGDGPEVDTDGFWVDGIFISQSEDGAMTGFAASKPPIGVTDGSLLFPS